MGLREGNAGIEVAPFLPQLELARRIAASDLGLAVEVP